MIKILRYTLFRGRGKCLRVELYFQRYYCMSSMGTAHTESERE